MKNVKNVKVNVTFEPPWTPDMMTDYAREKLGYAPVSKTKVDQKINAEWE